MLFKAQLVGIRLFIIPTRNSYEMSMIERQTNVRVRTQAQLFSYIESGLMHLIFFQVIYTNEVKLSIIIQQYSIYLEFYSKAQLNRISYIEIGLMHHNINAFQVIQTNEHNPSILILHYSISNMIRHSVQNSILYSNWTYLSPTGCIGNKVCLQRHR